MDYRWRLLTTSCLVATAEGLIGGLSQLEAGDVVEFEHLQHLLGFWIHLDNVLFKSGHIGHVVVTTLAFFFLQLDRDTADLRVAQTLHQMRNKTANEKQISLSSGCTSYPRMGCSPSNLVSQRFCRDDGDFLNNALVGVEIQRQASVVFFNDDLRGLLDGLCTNTTLKLHKHGLVFTSLQQIMYELTIFQGFK